MNKRQVSILLLLMLASTPLFSQTAADQYQPILYFGAQKIYVGMPQREAIAALSSCCKLSPPAEPDKQIAPTLDSAGAGHFILPKEQSTQPILGTIYFSEGRVIRLSQELAPDVDTSDRELVSFVRALKRALPEGSNSATLTMRHESASNAESDVLTIVFPNGRGIEIRIGALDSPDSMNKRDFVTLDELLQPIR
jgi:hypothetical protein